MHSMEEAKKRYDAVPIPSELSQRVQREIERAQARRRRKRLLYRGLRGGTAAAAAAVLVFTAALNTNTAFAESAGNLPVIGAVARVLTFRSYEEETDDLKISVEIPSVDMISEDFDGLEQSVNEEILRLCEEYAAQAEKRAKEYREAFLATGGTEEEWEAHNIQIRVWYEVKSQTESHLSLAVMGTENWTSAYQETRYYNFDLKNGRLLTLKDILGDDYKRIADEEIRAQMAEREKEGAVYFEDFSGIDENTSFYLDEAGRPVVVFGAYAIAPGSEGTQEFVIAAAQEETDLGALVSLLGMKDEDTAGLFGGGEENWTEDKSFYIGRRFAADVYGTPCRIFTTCGEDKTVESVSVWIVGGEREVTETEADEWEARITDFVGAGPAGDEEISEGGNKNLRWTKDGTAITLHQMKDILTVSLQPAVGELK